MDGKLLKVITDVHDMNVAQVIDHYKSLADIELGLKTFSPTSGRAAATSLWRSSTSISNRPRRNAKGMNGD